jgi:hypothetical protein
MSSRRSGSEMSRTNRAGPTARRTANATVCALQGRGPTTRLGCERPASRVVGEHERPGSARILHPRSGGSRTTGRRPLHRRRGLPKILVPVHPPVTHRRWSVSSARRTTDRLPPEHAARCWRADRPLQDAQAARPAPRNPRQRSRCRPVPPNGRGNVQRAQPSLREQYQRSASGALVRVQSHATLSIAPLSGPIPGLDKCRSNFLL